MGSQDFEPVVGTGRAETAPFIAADIGGTHVRLALVRGGAEGAIEVLDYRKYDCTEFAGLAEFVADFLAAAGARVSRGVIASAGYALDDGTVITTNLPWPLSIRETRGRLGLDDLRLVNDFEAAAHAAAVVEPEPALKLHGPDAAPVRGPVVVLGPGTGLGAAVWIPGANGGGQVLATEAGQAALAAGNDTELALLALLLKRHGHAKIEHVLSGPGLLGTYTALCELRGAKPALTAPDQVTAAAQAGSDPLAREALDVFCGVLGSTVGDMALAYGAQGGIRLAGGFLPQIREFLASSSFVARYLNKGPMRAALERIPVHLVEHGQLGVIGAARWYLGQTQDE